MLAVALAGGEPQDHRATLEGQRDDAPTVKGNPASSRWELGFPSVSLFTWERSL